MDTPTQTPPTTPAEPPPPQPWHSGLFADDSGKFASDWTTKLPDTLGEYRAMAAQYPDLGTLLKSHRDNMAAARSKGLKLPGEHATDDERQQFAAELRKVRGVPEAPDAYDIPAPEGLPEGLDWKAATAEFRAVAHELGLTPQEAQRLAQFDQQRTAAAQAQQKAMRDQIIAADQAEIRNRWGEQANAVLAEARQAAAEYLPAEAFDPTNDQFVGIQAAEAFYQLAQKLRPAGHIPAPALANLSPADLAKDIITNPNNPDHAAYMDQAHPQSARVRAKVADLYKRAG